MKRLLPSSLTVIFFVAAAFSSTAQFITTWETTTDGESITIPTHPDETYDYVVDWGDGSDPTNEIENATHAYETAGTYEVSITGTFPRIYFDDAGDKRKLINIEKWGNNEWSSMESAFYGCLNLSSSATDAPNLSSVQSLKQMFRDCQSLEGDFNSWEVNSITDMSFAFRNADSFNSNLNQWDVSNVQDMSYMFYDADSYNEDLNNWNVGNVTDMSQMFRDTEVFDGDLSTWNVSAVTTMRSMFQGAKRFNGDVSNWNVGNVTDMYRMFKDASKFNGDLSGWNVSNVAEMSEMLTYSNMNRGNYDALLAGWSALPELQPGVSLGAAGRNYCSGAQARAILVSEPHNWTINDSGSSCSQSITFNSLPPVALNTETFELGATVSSNLPISYQSSNEEVATIEGSTVHLLSVGETTITASQPGDGSYQAATDKARVLVVKNSQQIDFDELPELAPGDNPHVLEAIASSNLQVAYSISTPPMDFENAEIHEAFQLAGAALPFISTTNSFSGQYSIELGDISDKEYSSFSLQVTAGENASIKFAIKVNSERSWDICRFYVNGNSVGHWSGFLDWQFVSYQLPAGTYNLKWEYKKDVSASHGRDTWWIDDITLQNASSDVFDPSSVVTLSDGVVTVVDLGTVTIGAHQDGSDEFLEAESIYQELAIKHHQTLTFDALPTKTFGDPSFDLAAVGGITGNIVTFSSSDPSIATVDGRTVTITGAGIATIVAHQDGNEEYHSAEVEQVLTVNKGRQTIAFEALELVTYGDAAFDLTATGGASGAPILFTSSNTDVATIDRNTVTIAGAGTATITASQPGDDNFDPAADVEQVLTVNKASQTITFGALETIDEDAEDFELSATGGASGNDVTFASSDSQVATISGSTVSIEGPGTTTITASQAGNDNYLAAADVEQTLEVEDVLSIGSAEPTVGIYPNPASNMIQLSGEIAEVKKAVFYSISGQEVLSLLVKEKQVHLEQLGSGTYIMVLQDGEGNALHQAKIVKAN